MTEIIHSIPSIGIVSVEPLENPPVGHVKVYPKSDGLYKLDSDGNRVKIWPSAVEDLSNVSIDNKQNGQALIAAGSEWINSFLVDHTYIVTLTQAQAVTIINNDGLIPGVYYNVIDAHPDLYGGTSIFLQALTTNKFTNEGYGLFYNPKYGTYPVWNSSLTPSPGDKVIWGGKVWTNVNGLVGASINIYTLNSEWLVISYDEINYNLVIDKIYFHTKDFKIIGREDIYGNIIKNEVRYDGYGNSVQAFQWGANTGLWSTVVKGNEVINSICININNTCREFVNNKVFNFSALLGSFNGGVVCRNIIQNNSYIGLSINSNNSQFTENIFEQNSSTNGPPPHYYSSLSLTNTVFTKNRVGSSSVFSGNFTDCQVFSNIIEQFSIFDITASSSYVNHNSISNLADVKVTLSNNSRFENNVFSTAPTNTIVLNNSNMEQNSVTALGSLIVNATDCYSVNQNVISGSSIVNLIMTSYSNFNYNHVSDASVITATLIQSNFVLNNLSGNSNVINNFANTTFQSNIFSNSGYFQNNNVTNWCNINNNVIDSNSLIFNNTFNQATITNNIFSNATLFGGTQPNIITSSSLVNNRFEASEIYNNTITGTSTLGRNRFSASKFSGNTISSTFHFWNNEFNSESELIGNTLTGGYMNANFVSSGSSVDNNVLVGCSINKNIIEGNGSFDYNSLTSSIVLENNIKGDSSLSLFTSTIGVTLKNNIISGSSGLTSLGCRGEISNNTIENNSPVSIVGDFSSGNVTNNFIRNGSQLNLDNTSSRFCNNTISENSNMSLSLTSSDVWNNIISSESTISNVTFTNYAEFSFNVIESGSDISHSSFNNSSRINNNHISNSQFTQNSFDSSDFIGNLLGNSSFFRYNTVSGHSSIVINTIINNSWIGIISDTNIFAGSSNFANNTLNGSFYTKNSLTNSYLNSNMFINGTEVYNNTFISATVTNNNFNSNSWFKNNNLNNVSVSNNKVNSGSFINGNTNIYAGDNTLNNNSSIENNTENNINFNNINNASKIYNNTRIHMYSNSLNGNSFIQNNTGSSYSGEITNNTLTGNSYIDSNVYSNYQNIISNNVLSNYSSIVTNILTGYNYIWFNQLSSSKIVNNSLHHTSNPVLSETFTFTNGSNIVTTPSNVTDLLRIISTIYLTADGAPSAQQITDISWNGTQTSITLQNNYLGTGGSGTATTSLVNITIKDNELSSGSKIYNNSLTDSCIIANVLAGGSLIQNNVPYRSVFGYNNLNNSSLDFSAGAVDDKRVDQITVRNSWATGDISAATIIYGNYSKEIIKRQDGTLRLLYFNNSDVLTPVTITT